ncbi:MAG: CorA family divalent cation transporter [Bacteroidales bacterium]
MVSPDKVTWINIDGLHDTTLLSEIGERFRVPNLAMEDILNTDHRPKMFEGEDHIAIILKSTALQNGNSLEIDQVSFIIGQDFLLSFQETTGTFFEPVRERLRQNTGKLRQKGSDSSLLLTDGCTGRQLPSDSQTSWEKSSRNGG